MKLDEFISNVLKDINLGLKNAQNSTDREYHIQSGSEDKGVHFDIAVTTTATSDSKAEGTAKVGFIQVLGADVGAEVEEKKEKSQVSRIQFSVYVPIHTKREVAQDLVKMPTSEVDWGI